MQLGFWPQVWIHFFDAFFTAVFVGILAGAAVMLLQHKVEANQAERDSARSEATRAREYILQTERENAQTSREFIRRTSEIAGAFYFATQHYSRQKKDSETWGTPDSDKLDRLYMDWAQNAEALGKELGASYGWDSEPETLWHQIRDLLTVRYFDLRERNTENLRRANAKNKEGNILHSGLSVEELEDQKVVLAALRSSFKKEADAYLRGPLRSIG